MKHSLQTQAHAIAMEKGFWDDNDNTLNYLASKIALMHSELSECLESLRKGNPPDEHIPEEYNCVIELADCVIRIMDFCGYMGWDLEDAIVKKMAYNSGREYKHGKNF